MMVQRQIYQAASSVNFPHLPGMVFRAYQPLQPAVPPLLPNSIVRDSCVESTLFPRSVDLHTAIPEA